MTDTQLPVSGFAALGVAPNVLDVLNRLNLVTPTPIQREAIPPALEGNDVVGIAQTGTGKTMAFGLPMMQRIAREKGMGLVLVPTRELALQVESVLQKIGGPLGLKTTVIIGGASMDRQVQALKRSAHIIVATPGRLVDHLSKKNIPINQITTVVLDEADRMFDIGFAPQISRILESLPKNRQTMLFSATMPSEIASLAAKHMRKPLRIEVAPPGISPSQIDQEVYIVSKNAKAALLEKMLYDHKGTVLVFSRTKHGAKKITTSIRHLGHTAEEIHSNRSLAQRKRALDGFKSGTHRVLVATDIAARGIDVKNISLVINYDLPDSLEDYVHRVGRTGRAGSAGKAISFATPDQKGDIKSIERLIRKTIRVLDVPTDIAAQAAAYRPSEDREDRPSRERRPSGGRGGYQSRPRTGGSRGSSHSRGGFAPRRDTRSFDGASRPVAGERSFARPSRFGQRPHRFETPSSAPQGERSEDRGGYQSRPPMRGGRSGSRPYFSRNSGGRRPPSNGPSRFGGNRGPSRPSQGGNHGRPSPRGGRQSQSWN